NKAVARRTVLAAGATASAGTALAALAVGSPAAAATGEAPSGHGKGKGKGRIGLNFTPVEPNVRDNVTVPIGYDYDVIISWGDRLFPDAPEFDVYHQTPEAQARQFGYNCDFIGAFPHPTKRDRLILTVNHEYTNEEL